MATGPCRDDAIPDPGVAAMEVVVSQDQDADPRWAVVDEQLLEEIDVLTRLVAAAASRAGPLEQAEIDQLLQGGATVNRAPPRAIPDQRAPWGA